VYPVVGLWRNAVPRDHHHRRTVMKMRLKKIIAVCAVVGAMLLAGNTADARWGSRYYRPYVSGSRVTTPYYWSRPNHWYSNSYYRAPYRQYYYYR
jgi:hypothetical protein